MAWQDDTPFEAIAQQFGLSQAKVIALMRQHLKARSFRVWRMRVRGRAAKHQTRQALMQGFVQGRSDSNALGLMPQSGHGHGHAHAHADAQAQAADDDFPLPPSPLTAASLR